MSGEQDFKVGDKVQIDPYYAIGEIIAIGGDPANLCYCVKFDTGICAYYYRDELKLVDENHIGRRTAFLRRLQSLLREFNAAIEPEYSSYSKVGIVSIIVGSECVVESYDTITADNIMDFDKEGV